jgi:hypothetical protein
MWRRIDGDALPRASTRISSKKPKERTIHDIERRSLGERSHGSLMISRRFHLGIAFLAILLAGCGSTFTTRIQSRAAPPVPAGMLDRAEINRGVRAIERGTGINRRESDAAVRELVRRAGTDPQRLAEAAQVALQRAEGLPASKGQERAGLCARCLRNRLSKPKRIRPAGLTLASERSDAKTSRSLQYRIGHIHFRIL